MPFRISMTKGDVQDAMSSQGYTATRAPKLDQLDAAVSSRAAPGAPMDLTAGAETKVKTQAQGALTDQGYTTTRAPKLDNLDTAVSSRAASGAAMDLVAAARAAIWNELVPGTPDPGSYGERLKNNLDVAVGTRPSGSDYTPTRASKLDNLDAAITTRASPAEVDTKLADRGVTSARMAKMDMMGAAASASGAADSGAELSVVLDTERRAVVEIRYSRGAGAVTADFYVEGSEDQATWYEGDHFQETGEVTNKLVGYLNCHRYIRFRSPAVGCTRSGEIRALL